MGAKAHRRHPDAGVSHRLDQRQTLLGAPVQSRKAHVRFIERHFHKIKAQRLRQLQPLQPALPGGERFFIDAERNGFRQHNRSLTPQLGDRAFKLARRFHRRGGIADAAPGNKDVNRDPGEQRQVFQRQTAGDGHFEAHIG